MAVRAVWKDTVIAEAGEDEVKIVEGNVYFPPETVDVGLLAESPRTSRCYWKGKASYFHVDVDGELNPDAAWTYRKPWPLARNLKDHVAFWRGVHITKS